MDKSEEKYDLEESEETEDFHRSRRMFCIYNNQLLTAESNIPYSHAVWFEKEGLISRTKEDLINSIVRGYAIEDVYFYIGYDFRVNKRTETIFFSHLKELAEKIELKPDAKIFGGAIKQEAGKLFLPRKEYGKIMDFL